MSSSEHLAALLPSYPNTLTLGTVSTPTPGPGEYLIAVRSIALNPIDWYQRTSGLYVENSPAVLGSDISGTIESCGPSTTLKPGTRVTAFAPCVLKGAAVRYGGFQERAVVLESAICAIPDELSYNQAAILPMAVFTAWAGWHTIGVPWDTDGAGKAMLVWGGASSVGSAAVQTARWMGFTVYATASSKHHEYIKSLGASRMFDYKEPGVVEAIVAAAKADGLAIDLSYDAVGAVKQSMAVVARARGEGVVGKLASAVPLSGDEKEEGVEARFVRAPENGQEEWFAWVFREWLGERLVKGEFVPSPKVRVIEGGLSKLNDALDVLEKGVSGEKLVLEI